MTANEALFARAQRTIPVRPRREIVDHGPCPSCGRPVVTGDDLVLLDAHAGDPVLDDAAFYRACRGLLAPGLFLPDIEGHALSAQLGDWVLGAALEQLSNWTAAGLGVAIPAVLAYNVLGRWSARIEAVLEAFAHDLRAWALAQTPDA